MQEFILLTHVLMAIGIIALVLVQHGKGADIGSAFGSGASQTMFGSAGSTTFLVKLTGILTAVFFATSISLTYLAGQQAKLQGEILMPAPQERTIDQPVKSSDESTVPTVPTPTEEK